MTKTSREWLSQSRQAGIVALVASGVGVALWLGARSLGRLDLTGLGTGSKAIAGGERELGSWLVVA